LRELSVAELEERADSLREKIYKMRSRQALKELERGVDIRIARRSLARVLTILDEKRRQQAATSAS